MIILPVLEQYCAHY